MAKISVDQVLLKAKSHAKKGEIEDAKKLYQSVLQAFPKNVRAQQGLTALIKPMQNDASQAVPQEVIDRLLALYNKGQLTAVVEQAKALTEQYPEAFIVWNVLGGANKGLGRTDDAANAFKRVTELNPTYADGFSNLGITLQEQGKLDEAIAAYNKALSIKPDYAEAYNNMGVTLQEQGKLDEAIAAYNKALSIKPAYDNAHYNMGNALKDQGKLDEAIAAYNKALSIKPDYADAYNNMGNALKDQGKLDEAIAAYNKALSIKPDYADAYNNMGNALKDQGKLEEAIAAYNKALSIKPDYAEAYNNMGVTLQEQGKLDEAIEAYNKALSIKPDYAEAYNNKSHSHLLMGDFNNGWDLYEWRTQKKDGTTRKAREHLSWDGTKNISGKRFVVYEEQGLGDKIQFCRYLPLLVQENAFVTFQVTSALHSLLGTLDSNIILTNGLPSEDQIDFEVPLMSLPYLFKTEPKTIPASIPYLYADEAKVKLWAERLHKDNFKIGICWQGSKTKVDVGRSFPLSLFEKISRISDVELISLHKGLGEDQVSDVNFNLTSFDGNFDTGTDAFIDTAAIMANCDLIITSDTAVAHLAGALGRPTWVALKYIPDWRWMLNRSDNQWYPTMTLYRQKITGDWASVFDAINQDLLLLIDQKRTMT